MALVFLHGWGQSGKSWETTPDGRDGFQNIFLEKNFPVYIVDQLRRGRAGQSTEPLNFPARPDDQLWYNTFRIGEYPNFSDNVKVPRDAESLSQFFHQMTPSFAADQKIIADAMIKVFEKSGDGILITHSTGGVSARETAIRSNKVKAVISLEPGAFPFSEGEVQPVEKTTSVFPAVGTEISCADFMKLTKIPIVVYFGDNIPSGNEPVANLGKDNWRVRLNLAKKFAEVVNKYGGDCEIVSLPEVADVIESCLKSKGLTK